jgi:hypothetical protein
MDEPELVIQSIREVVHAASEKKGDELKDNDSNTYTSKVMLDGKRWMTQNLKTKITGSYCFDDKQANCDRYGRWYTWEAAMQACDMLGDGWRLPTNDEWRAMAKQYGGVYLNPPKNPPSIAEGLDGDEFCIVGASPTINCSYKVH